MSNHPENQTTNPVTGLISMIFYLLVPFSMIVMLGFVGYAFISDSGYRTPIVAVTTASMVPAPGSELTSVAAASAVVDPAQMEMGKASYMICMACHGSDGKGMSAGTLKMAPGLAGSKVLLGNSEASVAAVLKGIKKEDANYLQIMIALPLDDEKLAAVLTYARNSFGNSASPVSKEFVAEVRSRWASSTDPLTRAEVEKLSTQE